MTADSDDKPKREWDDFDDPEPTDNIKLSETTSAVAVTALPALRGMLSDMTILPVKATEEDRDIGYENPSLLPLVGIFFGLILMVLMKVVEMFENSLNVMMGPFFAILALAVPLVIFRFEFLGCLIRFGNTLFPDASKGANIPVAGVGIAIISLGGSMILYVMAAGFVGTFFLGLVIAMTEIFTLNTLASTKAFAQGASLGGAMVSTVISVIGAVALSILWMLINGNFYASLIIAAIVIAALSILIGYLVAAHCKKRLGGVTDDAIGASVELSRMFIIAVTIFVVMLL